MARWVKLDCPWGHAVSGLLSLHCHDYILPPYATGVPPELLLPRIALIKKHSSVPSGEVQGRIDADAGDETIGIHSNGLHTNPMEWVGSQCIGVHCITIDTTPNLGDRGRQKQNGSWESVTTMPAISPITWR